MTTAAFTVVQYAAGAVTVLILLRTAKCGSPFALARDGLRRLLEPAYRRWFLLATAVMTFNLIETAFDDALTARLGLDFTGWLWRWEGALIAPLQRADWPPLIAVLTFFYIVVFPMLIVASMLLHAARNDFRAYRGLLLGLVLNYVLVLPFLIFFPVREAWSGASGHIALLIDHLGPSIMRAYRATSALDNSFPSFHTSMAATTAFLAWRNCPQPFAWVVSVSASLVVFSTLYLGIHWACDVAAGLLVAAAVCAIVDRRRCPQISTTPAPSAANRELLRR